MAQAPNIFKTATNTKVSVGSSSTSVLTAGSRVYALFVNDSDEDMYLSLSGTAVMNEGFLLKTGGGAYEINDSRLYTGAVSAISLTGTKNLTVVEA